MKTERSIIKTIYGEAEVIVFQFDDNVIIPALFRCGKGIPLVRIQSQCLLGTVFSSVDCDCGEQMRKAMKILFAQDHFLLIYLTDQEARGYGLFKKIKILSKYHECGNIHLAREFNHAEQDLRKYDRVVEIINFLGLKTILVLTDDKMKIKYMLDSNINVEAVYGFGDYK